jgi:hypothetical protein
MDSKARKILTSILGAAVQAVARDQTAPVITPLNAGLVEAALVEKAASIPEVVNAVNAEPLVQSRILWGLGIAGSGATGLAAIPIAQLVAAIALVVRPLGLEFPPEDQAVWVDAGNGIVTIAGLLYAGYGRIASGLKPMWSRLRAWLG